MLALCIVLAALSATPGENAYTPRNPRSGTVTGFGVTPDESLTDEEARERAASYVRTIDVPVTADQWRALGPRVVPFLESVAVNGQQLPSRRAAAVSGLAAIGGERSRNVMVTIAQSQEEPFAVRAAAVRGAPCVLGTKDLVRELRPVLERAREAPMRATAAEVLAGTAPQIACPAIRAQAGRERGDHFRRALDRCATTP